MQKRFNRKIDIYEARELSRKIVPDSKSKFFSISEQNLCTALIITVARNYERRDFFTVVTLLAELIRNNGDYHKTIGDISQGIPGDKTYTFGKAWNMYDSMPESMRLTIAHSLMEHFANIGITTKTEPKTEPKKKRELSPSPNQFMIEQETEKGGS